MCNRKSGLQNTILKFIYYENVLYLLLTFVLEIFFFTKYQKNKVGKFSSNSKDEVKEFLKACNVKNIIFAVENLLFLLSCNLGEGVIGSYYILYIGLPPVEFYSIIFIFYKSV